MVIEIRKIGGRLALYTDDADVYERFHIWRDTLCEVPYTQGGKRIAVDLYFDSKIKGIVTMVSDGQLMLDI